jgi:hypothetical protein
MLSIVRRWHPEGEDIPIYKYMAEMRTLLGDSSRVLERKWQEIGAEVVVSRHYGDVANARAMMRDLRVNINEAGGPVKVRSHLNMLLNAHAPLMGYSPTFRLSSIHLKGVISDPIIC